MSIAEMTEEIVNELKVEFQNTPEYSEAILRNKIKSVIRELRMKRNYIASGLSEDEIEADMECYYSVILNVARYDYNQMGAEGEVTHSENGILRTYESRDSLWKGVHAFVKVF